MSLETLNNLGRLYQDTNRLAEAEPLLRRALVTLFKSSRSAGHPLPDLKAQLQNYKTLLGKRSFPNAEVTSRLVEAGREAGYSQEEFTALFKQPGE